MPHVLILDERAQNLRTFERLLAQITDIEPIAFDNPTEALRWLTSAPSGEPWLVVVEQNSPPPDGLSFIPLLHGVKGKADVPIIVVTDASRELRREALRMGAAATLVKPVDPIEFLAFVRNVLATRRAALQTAQQAGLATEQARYHADLGAELEAQTVVHLQAMVAARDARTRQHLLRVGKYTELIALKLGLSAPEVATIALAATLHDVGKVAIPDRIFFKSSRLIAPERSIVQRHAQAGHDILMGSLSPVLQTAAAIALTHHEHVDGSGYPAGLRGEDIPLGGRLAAVADVFAAVTSHRPYRDALPPATAVEGIERYRGTRYDPDVVDAFRAALPEIMAARSAIPDLLSTSRG